MTSISEFAAADILPFAPDTPGGPTRISLPEAGLKAGVASLCFLAFRKALGWPGLELRCVDFCYGPRDDSGDL